MSSPQCRLHRQIHFSAAHFYASERLGENENIQLFGACYSAKGHGHGHNYRLEIVIEAPINDLTGMTVNLAELDRVLETLKQELHFRHLNHDVAYFATVVPTTENISRYCFEKLKGPITQLKGRLVKIVVREDDDLWAEFGDL